MDNQYKFTPTHYGSFLGIPCLIDMTDDEAPGIEARYYLSWLMAIMEWLFSLFCAIQCFIDPEYEPLFAIKIKGSLKDVGYIAA